ncbi:hypothetical protein ACMZOO_04975 [Catenovulum sp. SX2]|uniref:hypothetical protein n=1 Tax=Catenovulum sp. SX2 TaxID=3398614 RepID=UPI003F84C676
MNIFIDTEFTCLPGDESHSEIMSIGIYCEDGSHYYGVLSDFNQLHHSPFVAEHALPLLPPNSTRKPKHIISNELVSFLIGKDITSVWATFPTVEQLKKLFSVSTDVEYIYQKYADWDYQLLLDLLGELPKGFPTFCKDITPLYKSLKTSEVPENSRTHDALQDAIWNYKVWEVATSK